VNGVPQGVGRFVAPLEGRVYEGEIHQGRPHGRGKEIDERSSTTYQGEFNNGVKHGSGTLQSPHHKYKGEWRHDQMEGNGVMRWKSSRLPKCDEEEYSGQWRAGRQHGIGDLTVFDYRGRKKLMFKGEWKDGLRDGAGMELSPTGAVLREGYWEHGIFVESISSSGNLTVEEKPSSSIRGRTRSKRTSKDAKDNQGEGRERVAHGRTRAVKVADQNDAKVPPLVKKTMRRKSSATIKEKIPAKDTTCEPPKK